MRCKACGEMIPIDLALDSFKDLLSYEERTVECPACEQMQSWNLDSIDTSKNTKLSTPQDESSSR
jgi:transposase